MGSAPVGVILVDGGRLAVVADSNRFAGRGAQWLSVVSTQPALAGRPALAGQVRAGSFPRQFALSPDGPPRPGHQARPDRADRRDG